MGEKLQTCAGISMIILAGGKSSRMGQDKCDLEYGGTTFLEHQIQKGRELGISDILISGYRGRCSAPVIPDRFPERGPLGGLEACLRRAAHPRCLVLGVDVPLLSQEDLLALGKRGLESRAKAVLLQHGQRLEPLIGVYDSSLADPMAEELVSGKGSVLGFLCRFGYEVYSSGSPEECFSNINAPDDYRRMTCR